MAQTFKQIQKQIEALQRQADKLRDSEIQGVVSRIKVAIKHYGLTAEQLGVGAKSGPTRSKQETAAPSHSAKYSDGQGNVWSGRGSRPHWLRDALNAGRTLDEFTAAGAKPTKAESKPKKMSKRRPSSLLYRDEAGHTWTGRGPQPRWLKEALTSGKTLEELSR
ncbi:DNA binding protein, nucleoid-associated [Variovorax sp. SRS16]|uniref:H-NS family nucleoid-associated regulatory protein n=1 Tax=Variovorax sp. SRS16 TaxID=282217 RepID=UPI0013174134|nr:H-NS family nucleoid-associated regulatory protein [Variovorax sp. SRS16]VTU31703.1 DNA binding protein, nucleoid-associated [Variovorax sp. SRS16]